MNNTENKPTVGIIEQDYEVADLVGMIVENEGFTPVHQSLDRIMNTPTLYDEFVKRENPDVVIIDVPNPYETSFEFVLSLMRSDPSGDRRFILTTTDSSRVQRLVEEMIPGPQALRPDVLPKPFNLEDLSRKVRLGRRNILEQHQAA